MYPEWGGPSARFGKIAYDTRGNDITHLGLRPVFIPKSENQDNNS